MIEKAPKLTVLVRAAEMKRMNQCHRAEIWEWYWLILTNTYNPSKISVRTTFKSNTPIFSPCFSAPIPSHISIRSFPKHAFLPKTNLFPSFLVFGCWYGCAAL
jgi:hypothetical protein